MVLPSLTTLLLVSLPAWSCSQSYKTKQKVYNSKIRNQTRCIVRPKPPIKHVFKRRGKQQQVTETEDIHIYGSFSDMGLHENLLKGMYQYGRSYVIFVFLRCQFLRIISVLGTFHRPDFVLIQRSCAILFKVWRSLPLSIK